MTGEPGTFPRRLVAQARRLGRKVALREKKYGIWQEVTWEQYAAQVRAVCLGLVWLGLERGDKVAVISGNRPAWLYVELAAQSAGAIPLGIFRATSGPAPLDSARRLPTSLKQTARFAGDRPHASGKGAALGAGDSPSLSRAPSISRDDHRQRTSA